MRSILSVNPWCQNVKAFKVGHYISIESTFSRFQTPVSLTAPICKALNMDVVLNMPHCCIMAAHCSLEPVMASQIPYRSAAPNIPDWKVCKALGVAARVGPESRKSQTDRGVEQPIWAWRTGGEDIVVAWGKQLTQVYQITELSSTLSQCQGTCKYKLHCINLLRKNKADK